MLTNCSQRVMNCFIHFHSVVRDHWQISVVIVLPSLFFFSSSVLLLLLCISFPNFGHIFFLSPAFVCFLFLCIFWKFCPGYEPQRNISINEIVSMFTLQLVGRIYFFDMWLFGQLATAWHVSEFLLWFRKRSIKLWRNYELNIIYKHHRS